MHARPHVCACVANADILWQGAIQSTWEFAMRHPALQSDLLWLCVYGALGNCFIFLTIAKFDALQLTVITTIRKFLTLIASIIIFGHELLPVEYAAVAMVFGGTILNVTDTIHHKNKHAIASAGANGPQGLTQTAAATTTGQKMD
jgi:drug/metabolite transporter (DMT)-like permease